MPSRSTAQEKHTEDEAHELQALRQASVRGGGGRGAGKRTCASRSPVLALKADAEWVRPLPWDLSHGLFRPQDACRALHVVMGSWLSSRPMAAHRSGSALLGKERGRALLRGCCTRRPRVASRGWEHACFPGAPCPVPRRHPAHLLPRPSPPLLPPVPLGRRFSSQQPVSQASWLPAATNAVGTLEDHRDQRCGHARLQRRILGVLMR